MIDGLSEGAWKGQAIAANDLVTTSIQDLNVRIENTLCLGGNLSTWFSLSLQTMIDIFFRYKWCTLVT